MTKRWLTRLAIYVCALTFSAAVIHLHVAHPLFLPNLFYRITTLTIDPAITCQPDAPEQLNALLKRVSAPYFAENTIIVYVDRESHLYECQVASDTESPDRPVFRFASLTKAVTAFAILELSLKGEVDLDASILAFFPEINKDAARDSNLSLVSLNHLLNHSSGFGGPFGSDNMVKEGEKPWCPYEFEQLEEVRLAGKPGTNHLYSNVAYCLLGEVIARLSGETYRDYIRNTYLLDYSTLDFVDGGFLADEPEYDFTYAYRLGREYVEWLDFYAISSSAGLRGNPAELAHLIWTLNRRNPDLIFRGPQVPQCERTNGFCYSYSFALEKGANEHFPIAVQHGYMPGASSLLAISTAGEVIVWVAAGAPAESEYKQRLVAEVVKFFDTARALKRR